MSRATRPLLYVCAPFATRTPDEEAATNEAISWALVLGWCPVFAPNLLRDVLSDSDPAERSRAMECAVTLAARADAILVVGARVTEGMSEELRAWSVRDPEAERAFAFGSAPGPQLPRAFTLGAERGRLMPRTLA